MKRLKRFFAMLLVLVMLVVILAGCGAVCDDCGGRNNVREISIFGEILGRWCSDCTGGIFD